MAASCTTDEWFEISPTGKRTPIDKPKPPAPSVKGKVRMGNEWKDFLLSAGSPIDQRCLWATEDKLNALFARGEYTAEQATILENLSGKQKDICFGLFNPKQDKTTLQPLQEWATENGGITYYYNMPERGFCNTFNRSDRTVPDEIIQAIIRCRQNGGKIHFRLDGIDAGIMKNYLSGKKARNPSEIIATVSNIPDYTIFELQNVTRNQDWLNNTIFYRYDKVLTMANDAAELEKKFGIKFFSE